jgi:hypothetical protein
VKTAPIISATHVRKAGRLIRSGLRSQYISSWVEDQPGAFISRGLVSHFGRFSQNDTVSPTLSTPFEFHGLRGRNEIALSNKFKKLLYGLLNAGYL